VQVERALVERALGMESAMVMEPAMVLALRVIPAPAIPGPLVSVRQASPPRARPGKMAQPALPVGCRSPMPARRHQLTNSACEFEPAHPSYRQKSRRRLLIDILLRPDESVCQ